MTKPKTFPGSDRLLLVRDVLRILRIEHGLDDLTYWRLWRALIEGRIPAQRPGRDWRVDPDDLGRIADHFRARGAA